MLRKAELRVLAELHEPATITDLADRINRSANYVSEVVSDLEEKGLVRKERLGRAKQVASIESKAIELYHDIAQQYGHIDPPALLSGPTVSLLYYLNEPITVAELAERTDNYRNTVNRRIKQLLDRGIVRKAGSRYQLNEGFQVLHEFAREYVHHVHRQRAAEAADAFTILWEDQATFLIRTDQSVTDEAFLLTGPERFEEYGVPLFATRSRYYVYPAERVDLTPEELICHTLAIDSGSRYQSYCLLLLGANAIDESRLRDRSEIYNVRTTVDRLLEYLNSRGESGGANLPTWAEFQDLADEYGVAV